MKITDIQKKARSLGIKDVWKFPKKELIRSIQRKEGNFDCFARTESYCEHLQCLWRGECKKK